MPDALLACLAGQPPQAPEQLTQRARELLAPAGDKPEALRLLKEHAAQAGFLSPCCEAAPAHCCDEETLLL